MGSHCLRGIATSSPGLPALGGPLAACPFGALAGTKYARAQGITLGALEAGTL